MQYGKTSRCQALALTAHQDLKATLDSASKCNTRYSYFTVLMPRKVRDATSKPARCHRNLKYSIRKNFAMPSLRPYGPLGSKIKTRYRYFTLLMPRKVCDATSKPSRYHHNLKYYMRYGKTSRLSPYGTSRSKFNIRYSYITLLMPRKVRDATSYSPHGAIKI